MATIICKCGCVELKFPPNPIMFTGECCCKSRYDFLGWAARHGGPELPEDYVAGKHPLLVAKLFNRMRVVRGMEVVAFIKSMVDMDTTNLVCSKCFTVLVFDHTMTQKSAVGFFPDVVEHHGMGDIPAPLIRWNTIEWDEKSLKKLPPLPAIWADPEV